MADASTDSGVSEKTAPIEMLTEQAWPASEDRRVLSHLPAGGAAAVDQHSAVLFGDQRRSGAHSGLSGTEWKQDGRLAPSKHSAVVTAQGALAEVVDIVVHNVASAPLS